VIVGNGQQQPVELPGVWKTFGKGAFPHAPARRKRSTGAFSPAAPV
jgi:hypothetical protein